MKKFLSLSLLVFLVLGNAAFSCDESCLREKAEATHKAKFPSYLTWKYCEGIAMDFMSSAVRSLDNYRTKHFDTKFKGPLRNTRNYLVQRKEWLQECDDYLSKTKNTRVFTDTKTTKKIFNSIDSVNSEFAALIKGASYSNNADAKAVMDDKIDALFKHVDDHKTLLHLRGRYVVR